MNWNVTAQAGDKTLELSLPVCKIPGTDKNIIAFDSMGNMRVIKEVAKLLDAALPQFDVLVCPEAKAIPVGQALCNLRDVDYYVLRKACKLYMEEPASIDVRSITTQKDQKLWYCKKAASKYKGKRVLLFDDVVSTGATLRVLEKFASDLDLTVAAKAAIFAEGDAKDNKEVITLGYLPILKDSDLK